MVEAFFACSKVMSSDEKTFIQLKYLLGEFIFDLTNLEAVQCTFKLNKSALTTFIGTIHMFFTKSYLQCF